MPTLNRHFYITFTKTGNSVRRYYQERTTSTIGELIQTLTRQEGLPNLAYGLYRYNAIEELNPAMLVEQLNEGEELYLSSTPPPPQQHLPFVQPSLPQTPSRLFQCTIEVVQGDAIIVPYRGLVINRRFLLDHLTAKQVGQMEKLKAAGVSVPIMRVSRDIHCMISVHKAEWIVTAYQPTLCNGSNLRLKHPYPLDGSSILTLGKDGQQIRVCVFQK